MFIGPYGVSLAAKKADNRLSLWWLFLGAQFLDVLWALFILLGIEKLHIDAGLPSSKYVLYFMPYTHGLDTALLWSGVAYLAFRFLPLVPEVRRRKAARVMAAVVFSHWVLDLIVHRPDLPLVDNAYKVGLALYNYPLPGFILESLLLVGGMLLYLQATTARTPVGRYGPVVFGALLLLINVFTYWGPAPPSPQAAAIFNEASYFVLAGIALWLDRRRSPRDPIAQRTTAGRVVGGHS